MRYKSLTPEEVERFVQDGYVMVRGAFPRDFAQVVQGWLWKEMALPPDDPAAWTQPLVTLQKRFTGPEVEPAFSPRLFGAIDDLLGEGKWVRLENRLGGWKIAFPGHDAPPWRPPENDWWHIETLPTQRLGSWNIAITLISLFSDIDPGDGGTAVALGSHKIAARELAAAGADGLPNDELERRVKRHPLELQRVAELTGRAGDVALLHPLLAHCRSANTGKRVRFISNPNYPLKEAMNLRADVSEHTPLERSVLEAIRTTPARRLEQGGRPG